MKISFPSWLVPIIWQSWLMILPCVNGHQTWHFRTAESSMREFASRPGVIVTFENPVYINGYFTAFEGWNSMNEYYGSDNVTYIVRVEFELVGFKESRIRKKYKLFWLPGARWVELSSRHQHLYNKNLTLAKTRNHSHIDIWVEPTCFLRHNGIARIHRVAKSIKLQVHYLRWMAKINYDEVEAYGPRELTEISKAMTTVQGIQCGWVHPPIESSFSMMLRFFPNTFPLKAFFSPTHGYTNWEFLNNEYQVQGIHSLRGWNRALLDLAGGLHCRESHRQIAERYHSLPNIQFIYLDTLNECKFTYKIVLSFDRNVVAPENVRRYQDWNHLNYLYGVIRYTFDADNPLRAVLEFDPGLYTHIQMKAIRDEYLKLPGIKFGWVMGTRALEVSTIVLNFDKNFLRRSPMPRYHYWDALNKRYLANITIQDEVNSQAFIRFPKGVHSDLKLKAILRKYRQLPGIASVRMDREEFHLLGGESGSGMIETGITNSSFSGLPKRSIKSWISLSQGDTSNLPPEATDKSVDGFFSSNLFRQQQIPSQCISNN